MSDDPITILIADDNPDARSALRRQLEFAGLAVVGESGTAQETVMAAQRLAPDVVLVDLDPKGLDGLAATTLVASRLPSITVVVIAVGDEIDTIRRAMLAGARAYLTRPFVSDELVAVIRQAHARTQARTSGLAQVARVLSRPAAAIGHVVAVYGASGGVGRTTVAVNLAVSACSKGTRVALMDANLQFGDVGTFLDLPPNAPTIADLLDEGAEVDADQLSSILQRHQSGVDVLLAPVRPDDGALRADGIGGVLAGLADRFELVVVDMGPRLDETSLALLDRADRILVTTTLEVPAVKNAGLFLDLCRRLGYAEDKAILVANRVGLGSLLPPADVERALGREFAATIAEETHASVALNKGIPLIKARSRSAFAADIARLVGLLDDLAAAAVQPTVVQRAWLGDGAGTPTVGDRGDATSGPRPAGVVPPRSYPARLLEQRGAVRNAVAGEGG